MSNLIVITFDNADEAEQVLDALRQLKRSDQLSLDDSAVVVKDAKGKVRVKNAVDRGVKMGALGGGLLGLLLGGVFFPLAGLAVGVTGGALVGSSLDLGVDQKFVKDVTNALQPNTSALFIIVRSANPDVAINALKPYKGSVYHTSLAPDAEETLRKVLEERK
jgi:uncharacterized membrane protein